MAREFAVTLYLLVCRMLFGFFKLFPLRDKTTFIASFGANVQVTLNQLEQDLPGQEIVILKSASCQVDFEGRKVLRFESLHLLQFIQSIYHLATSRHIFVDNYYGILAVTPFHPEVKCVQLWHANGAIKQFGLEDLTNGLRSSRAMERFQKVYDRFDYVVVGSEKMKDIFKKSFGLPEDRFIRTGVPRTDVLFDDGWKTELVHELYTDFSILRQKKMILYAPTYRDGVFSANDVALDIEKLHEQFADDYVLFLRLHPAVVSVIDLDLPAFVYDVSTYKDINRLLVGADILITDYSSIPFEFCLLEKPMIFFAYDYEDYARERGVWLDYERRVPGPVVRTTNELIGIMESGAFELEKVRDFSKEWNLYADGNSAKKLIAALYDEASEERQIREHG